MKKALFICLVLCLAVCCAWAAADGLILKDAEGNILEDGARLEGKYYYIIYVEGAPEECEGIDTAWVQGEPDAEEPGEWSETSRHLYTDENGRFFVVMPILGQEYTEETMFARLDGNDPVLRKISFSYNRVDTIESEPPTLVTEEDPKVGQADYVLEWNPVEGAEMYEVFWVLPSGKLFSFLVVGKTELNMSSKEGMLDEAGECTLFLFPYGNGLPMSYSGWYCDVTE